MKMLVATAILLASLFNPAAARENYKETGIKADTKEAYAAVAADVRSEMEGGGRYEYVKPDERKTVDAKLTEMSALFEQSGSVANMKEDQKIALFNAQETVNSILTKRDRDRVICKKEAPIGSHIPVTTCHTYGQEEDARLATRKQLSDWKQAPCVGDNAACAGR
jgi:hypothetical protein